MSDDQVRDVARRAGIAMEWRDQAGQPRAVTPPVLQHILSALGLPADNSRGLAYSRRLLSRRGGVGELPPLLTSIAGRPTRLDIGGNEPVPAELVLDNGQVRALSLLPARGRLRVPAVAESGYHRLRVAERELLLAVSPARCRTIADVVPDARLFGVGITWRGAREGEAATGIDDITGVIGLTRWAGAKGADALALPSLHAMFADGPDWFAPMGPSSRLFLDPVRAVPDLVFGEPALGRESGEGGRAQPETVAAKQAALRRCFEAFLDGPAWDGAPGADFARYRAERGRPLYEHACFEALRATRSAQPDWRDWPTDLRDPGRAAVACFAAAQPEAVLYHQFLQWITDRSMAAAGRVARESGLRIGLIGTLAACVDPAGAEAWSLQGDMLRGLTIGAPPDALYPRGQDWGLTALSPRAVEQSGFWSFLTVVRSAMRHVGGLRLDHAAGMARLWVIPEGASPADGAYLHYPLSDLLRLLALESTRHNVVVIGHDWGHVPDGFADVLAQTGIHGTRALWRERGTDGEFHGPREWGDWDVAMTSAPDLPTVAGWWRGADIASPSRVVAEPGDAMEPDEAPRMRAADRPRLWAAFVNAHAAEGPVPAPAEADPVVDAAVRFIAQVETPLALVPLVDLLGLPDLAVPGDDGSGASELADTGSSGASDARGRLAGLTDDVLDDPGVARRIAILAAERPRR